ncbi:MAG TPA: (Fe-S)-binding protein [Candidatus Deferrimicrobium sp.]|nr:(Fe-S)-binding protein [Candidatus Deferrimicrobium sp.]
MNKIITTFPSQEGFNQAAELLKKMAAAYEIISPLSGFKMVGVPALLITPETRAAFLQQGGDKIITPGWVPHREMKISTPANEPETFKEDIFGRAMIVVLVPCIADQSKIRIVARISGDLEPVFPYVNAHMSGASYNPNGPSLTFMEGHRMIAIYPHRVAVAKADDIVDAWRVLEMLRVETNSCWLNRGQITPSYEMRRKPPALEIYFRLPKSNCKQCGETTCLAFALRLWSGEVKPHQCKPVFAGESGHLKDALLEICQGLGVRVENGSNGGNL